MARRDSKARIVAGIILAGAVLIFSPSCATKKFMLTLHGENMAKNREIETRLADLERTVAHIDSLNVEQYRQMMATRAYVGNQSQSQQENINSISARLDNINRILNDLNQKLQAIQLYGGVETPSSKTPGGPSDYTDSSPLAGGYNPISPSTAAVDPKEVYNTALADLNNGKYDLAESRFMAFIIQFPSHELAGNAQYWLGEVDYAQKRFALAVTEFEKVIDNYPKSEKVPASLLKMAYAQIEIGRKTEAAKTLRKLLKEYRNTDEAKLGREKLRKLGR